MSRGAALLAYAVDLCGASEVEHAELERNSSAHVTFQAHDSCGTVLLREEPSAVLITDLRKNGGPLACHSQTAIREAVSAFTLPPDFTPTPELSLITPLGRLTGPVYAPMTRPSARPAPDELQVWLKGPGLGGGDPSGPLELLVYERARPDRFRFKGEWRDLRPGDVGLAAQARTLGLHLRDLLFTDLFRQPAQRIRATDTCWVAQRVLDQASAHRQTLEAEIRSLTPGSRQDQPRGEEV